MIVIGVDPGWQQSAYVLFNGVSIIGHDLVRNEDALVSLETWKSDRDSDMVLVVEQISMGGMIAGAEIFETCFWSGRFVEAWHPRRWHRVKRTDVKKHICGQMRANDSNIRAALIERFGPDLQTAVGNKKQPGPLFGLTSHKWAAFAVALTWWDQNGHQPADIRPGVQPDF